MDEHGRSAVERPALLAYLVFRLCARGFANDRQKSILEYKAFSAYNSRLRLDLDGYTRTRGNRSRTCPASLRHIGGNRSHEETKDSRCTERRASENPQKGKQWESNSTSPGRRFQTVSDFAEITTSTPEKSLLAPLSNKAGRNNNGRITTRHQGGGNKRRYRIIDFKRNKDGVPAKVATIEYDPNRSARIALLHYVDGEKRYILHPKGLRVGDTVMSGVEADIKPGNALPLANIPVGTLIHAVELQPGKGAAIARSAGTSIQLMGKEGDYAILRMPSSEMRRVLITCRATVGEVGNAEHSNIKIGKAGRNRWKGIRPSVRGTVMNPVDHPHGGGEGKNKSAGRHPVTPWGVPTKGHRTRNPKKASSRLIIRRRKK